jgi:hypothetical protein
MLHSAGGVSRSCKAGRRPPTAPAPGREENEREPRIAVLVQDPQISHDLVVERDDPVVAGRLCLVMLEHGHAMVKVDERPFERKHLARPAPRFPQKPKGPAKGRRSHPRPLLRPPADGRSARLPPFLGHWRTQRTLAGGPGGVHDGLVLFLFEGLTGPQRRDRLAWAVVGRVQNFAFFHHESRTMPVHVGYGDA